MVTAWAAMVKVPERAAPVALVATPTLTVPLPVPDVPEVIVIHGALLDAVHAHALAADTMNVKLPPAVGADWLVGTTT
jgi:hypothetical protein